MDILEGDAGSSTRDRNLSFHNQLLSRLIQGTNLFPLSLLDRVSLEVEALTRR